MRITRGQFLRFAVVAIGTGGTAIVACDAGTAATPGDGEQGRDLPGAGDASEGGHRGPPKPDGGGDDASGDASTDANTTDGDASADGGEDGGADAGEDAPALSACEQNGGRESAISMNHPAPHVLSIPAADFANIQPTQSYNIKGGSAHPHTITLTAADMTALVGGQSVTVISTQDGTPPHTHVVTVVCA